MIGDVLLQIRTDKLLSPFIANISEDETCSKGPVPKYNYVPNYTGLVNLTYLPLVVWIVGDSSFSGLSKELN